MKISILLSTYNGERYLREQLDSIFNQTFQDFKLIVRDDGSSDNTMNILLDYQHKFPDKLILICDDFGNVGVAQSFKILMENSSADYYFFSDQDDVWMLNKIELLCNKLQLKEFEQDIPLLVFSNMNTFYNKVNYVNCDFFKRYKINIKRINTGLFKGTISGCLMAFNHSCKMKSLELNLKSNMLHDWNILQTAFLYGTIQIIPDQLISHRIHESNVVGENLTKEIKILLKDFFKYMFKSYLYRRIVLSYYFEYVNSISSNVVNSHRIYREMYNEDEVNNLGYIKRKKWYYKHFNPFLYGKIHGILILLTV